MSELEYLLNILSDNNGSRVLTVNDLSRMIEAAIEKKAKEDSEMDKYQEDMGN